MTRAGQSPVDRAILKRLARLVHIHHLTHPVRLAARYGPSVRYVRKQWETKPVRDLRGHTVMLDQWQTKQIGNAGANWLPFPMEPNRIQSFSGSRARVLFRFPEPVPRTAKDTASMQRGDRRVCPQDTHVLRSNLLNHDPAAGADVSLAPHPVTDPQRLYINAVHDLPFAPDLIANI